MVRDFLRVLSGRMGQTLIGIVSVFVLLRLMSRPDYGLVVLVTSVSALVAVFAQAGLSSSISKVVNDARVERPWAVGRLFRRGLRVQLVVLVAVTTIGVVVCRLVYPAYFRGQPFVLAGLVLLVTATVASEHVFRTARTFERFREITALVLLMGLARLVGLIVPYRLTGSIGLSLLSSGLLQAVIAAVYLYRLTRLTDRAAEGRTGPDPEQRFGAYLVEALPFLVIASSNILFSQIAQLVLGRTASIAHLADFDVALRVAGALRTPAIAFSFVVSSRFGRAILRGDAEETRRTLGLNALVSMTGIPIAALLFFNASWCVPFLAGEQYAASVEVTRWLCMYLAAAYVSDSFSLSLDYSGRSKRRAILVAVAAALNVTLALLLAPRYGLQGAALALTLSTVAQALFLIRLVEREYDFRFAGAIRPVAGSLVLCTALGLASLAAGFPLQGAAFSVAGTLAVAALFAVPAASLYQKMRFFAS